MANALLISDLHLEPGTPEILAQFLALLEGEARDADALYILGDLFEVWLGDDDPGPTAGQVRDALIALTAAGTRCFVMHGNRDFLIGSRFCEQTGCSLLDEHTVHERHGRRVLLMHGDLLCTDDTDYQSFRRMVRNPEWQRQMLAMSFEQRVALAAGMREQTAAEVRNKADEIMDVNQQTVEDTMRRFGVTTLLHGHTHRPATHEFALDGAPATRIVLGDWHTQGSLVRWDESGLSLHPLPR